jgi:hypothetical protein
MGKARIQIALASLLAGGMSACMPTVVRTLPPGERVVVANGDVESRSLKIPPGHYPKPGECRLWYANRPPGHQPRSGSCVGLARIAPAGSLILYRPASDRKVVHARVIDPKRDGVIIVTRIYSADRGTYLREEK